MTPCPPPDRMPRRPQLALPPGAVDCHAHVIGPLARYPLSAERVYTPPDCTASAYTAMLTAVGVARTVLVQPSVYGSDNRLLLDTLAEANPAHQRGVAVLAGDESDTELERWHAAGVRGARVNLVDRAERSGTLPMTALHALATRIAPLGWHLELLAHVDEAGDGLAALEALPVPVVFGHFGYMSIGRNVNDPGFRALLTLLRSGRAWVKFTGPYRLTRADLPYPEVDDAAIALREAAPERLVWGSDWPHVMLKGVMPNDADLNDLIARWLPGAGLRQQVLVDNPQQLYGFGAWKAPG